MTDSSPGTSPEHPNDFATVLRLTEAIMAGIGPAGELDPTVLQPPVIEMGDIGATGLVLTTWAQVLAATQPSSTESLLRFSAWTPEPWRAGTHHNATRMVTAAQATMRSDPDTTWLSQEMYTIHKSMGRDIWWLTALMAQATAPVLRATGGLERFTAILELTATWAAPGTPPYAISAAAAGLASIITRDVDAARDFLGMVDPYLLICALVPIADRVFPDRGQARFATLALDKETGLPIGVGPVEEVSDQITRRLLATVTTPTPDTDHLKVVMAEIKAADLDMQAQVSWMMAHTVGHYLARTLTSQGWPGRPG
ncbi:MULTISPECIES: hypothetical protein [unclassified Crossiella]|uniref:hypothetical protein n=1 Tax=unclassified Crossiella TaxID=2620835 RepID=UPI001FFF32DE|nr:MULTISPECIES: hypothetical protein [unclassified Crossiella]MCK2240091.1 hypothetical protein [Crossiella sp. S99.2]MCK2252800.1 hypothetical protein [Crossiella sp. S99.1]